MLRFYPFAQHPSVRRHLSRVHHLWLNDNAIKQSRGYKMISDRTNEAKIPACVPVVHLLVRKMSRKGERSRAVRGDEDALALIVVEDAVHIANKKVLHDLPS